MKNGKTLKWLLTLACLLAALCAFTLAANAAIVDSGYCGATGYGGNLTWTLDEAGTFTVSGTGDMENYSNLTSLPGSFAPWNTSNEEQQRIKTVVIENGVTSIGSHAFCGCKNLSTVIIPDSVTDIGGYAFHETAWYDNQPDGLIYVGKVAYSYKGEIPENTALVLKDGTKGIAESAFVNGYGLVSVTIPDGVTNIGSHAFENCPTVTSFTIPDSVTNIGGGAFGYGWYRNQPDGLVYAGKVVYSYKGEMPENTALVLKDGTKGIAAGAFSYRSDLTSIIIPDGVLSIGGGAFMDCTKLSSVTIPNSVTNIGYSAFRDCTTLVEMTVPDRVTNIGPGAFSGCKGLTALSVSANNPVYYSINNCIIEKSSKTLIAGCKNSVIPADGSVTSIGHYVFSGDMGLPSLTLPEGITVLGDQVFAGNCDLETIVIPDSVTGLGFEPFLYCQNLKQVTLGNGIKSIGLWAFVGCSSLTSIIIPESVKKIGSYSQKDPTVYDDPIPPQTVIYGYAGSYVQQWAKENNHIFYVISNATLKDATPTDAERKPGDADGDGKLTSADARLALRASVGQTDKGDVTKDSAGYLACDVDGDGKVSSADARLILRASVGLEDASKFGKKA